MQKASKHPPVLSLYSECFILVPSMHKDKESLLSFYREFLDLECFGYSSELEISKDKTYSIRIANRFVAHRIKLPVHDYFGYFEGRHWQSIDSLQLHDFRQEFCMRDAKARQNEYFFDEMKVILRESLDCEFKIIHGMSKIYSIWKLMMEDRESSENYWQMMENYEKPVDFEEALPNFIEKHRNQE